MYFSCIFVSYSAQIAALIGGAAPTLRGSYLYSLPYSSYVPFTPFLSLTTCRSVLGGSLTVVQRDDFVAFIPVIITGTSLGKHTVGYLHLMGNGAVNVVLSHSYKKLTLRASVRVRDWVEGKARWGREV